MLNIIVHTLLGFKHDDHHHGVPRSTEDDASLSDGRRNRDSANDSDEQEEQDDDVMNPPCCAHDPAAQLDRVQHMVEEMERVGAEEEKHEVGDDNNNGNNDENAEAEPQENRNTGLSKDESKKLSRMSLNTAIAIGMHNFPEGLATFVAALEDPKVGALLAIAIAIHNVPEGRCPIPHVKLITLVAGFFNSFPML